MVLPEWLAVVVAPALEVVVVVMVAVAVRMLVLVALVEWAVEGAHVFQNQTITAALAV
jgi:hypothetical protein